MFSKDLFINITIINITIITKEDHKQIQETSPIGVEEVREEKAEEFLQIIDQTIHN